MAQSGPFFDRLARKLVDEGFTLVDSAGADVAVIDVSAIGLSAAADVCRELKAGGAVVLAVASDGGAESLVDLLAQGVDDYLPQPDRLSELVARVRALLRRQPPSEAGHADVLRVGDVSLDAERHEVFVGDRPVHLPLKQFKLLELLLANAGHVLTRDTLLRRVWGLDAPTGSNSLEVQVKRLREAIEDDARHPLRVRTVRGIGYVFDGPR